MKIFLLVFALVGFSYPLFTQNSCDSIIIKTDTNTWQYQNGSGTWVNATLGINTCSQSAHAQGPINQIGISSANEMIWGSLSSTTCNLRRIINITDKSKIDSIRIKMQGDDNVVDMKINGTSITNTSFGWTNFSSVVISNTTLVNGSNVLTIQGDNSNGSCAWVAMKMIIYKKCDSHCVWINTSPCWTKDATVGSWASTTNYGNHNEYLAVSWTCGGSPCQGRSYFDFNLSEIPTNAVIESAKLYLKALPAGTAGNGYSGTPTFGTNNASTIRRVTQAWAENSITWTNKPTTTTTNQVTLPQSATTLQNYTVDMKTLIIDSRANPSSSFGYELKHIAEGTSYNSLIFGSSDHPTDSLRPRLEICYSIQTGTPTYDPPPYECDSNCNSWLKAIDSNDRVTVGDLDIAGNQLTIEAMVNQKFPESGVYGTYDDRDIVSKHTGQADCNYNLRTGHAGINTVNNGYIDVLVPCPKDTGKTYHIAMVYNGSTLKYYRNGFLLNSVSASGNLKQNNLVTNIANYAGTLATAAGVNHSARGYVNEVRLWNVARTQSQIRAYMDTSLPNPSSQTGLLGYYVFNSLINKQGNTAYNGTLVGGATINQVNPNCGFIKDSCIVICDSSSLITNGNFESGNTGFTSEYNYTPSSNTLGNQYTVATSNYPWNSFSSPCSDHTSGSGKMLVANGDSSLPSKKIWMTTVGVVPNKNYTFSYWLSSWSNSPAKMRLKINGADVGAIAVANTSFCTWNQFSYTWNSGSSTSASISLTDTSTVWIGNDYAIDDIVFKQICSQNVCDTSKKFTFTKCSNDTAQLNLRVGSNYSWTPTTGLTNPAIRNPQCFVSSNTTYLASYKDTNGCQLVDTMVVNMKSLNFAPIRDTTICNGDSVKFSIPIYATGIQWSPNTAISSATANSPYFYPNTSTTYYLKFTDSFGCKQYDTMYIEVKTCCPAKAKFNLSDSILCFGKSMFLTNVSTGTITGYNWSFGNANPSSSNAASAPILTFPGGNTYPIRLIVTNGVCFDTMTKNVTVVEFKPFAGRDSVECVSSLKVKLGEAALGTRTYSWTPTTYLDNASISNPTATIINGSVTYILVATDIASKCAFRDTVYLSNSFGGNVVNQTEQICQGDSFKFFNLTCKTAGPYQYKLTKKGSKCDSIEYNLNLNVVVPADITYVAAYHCRQYRDQYGKIWTQNLTVYDTIRSQMGCDSLRTKLPIIVQVPVYKDAQIVACDDTIFKGRYYNATKFKADSVIVKSKLTSCDSIITTYNIIINKGPVAKITASRANPIRVTDTVHLTAGGGQKFLWIEGGETTASIRIVPTSENSTWHTVRVIDTQTYCWDTAQYRVDIYISDTCEVFLPTAFIPNINNTNDVYMPRFNPCAKMNQFVIFNRWGEKMFETYKNEGWDGRFKGEIAPKGVYVYYLEMQVRTAIKYYKGSFTLFR